MCEREQPLASAYLVNMMEEMSMAMACDANFMDQMTEEEILACLVAETGPTFTVRLSAACIHSRTNKTQISRLTQLV